MKSLAAAVAFCTRIPVPVAFGAEEVGAAARWFPLVGALLGAVSIGISWLLAPHLPSLIVAALILLAEAGLTGALHMDGLADTADGLGGGKTKEDKLRIMRDHAIGSYGATVLILTFALKITAISSLIVRSTCSPYLVLAPMLGRWNIVLLSRFLPYARPSQAVSRHIGTRELIWATAIALLLTCLLGRWRGVSALLFSIASATFWGLFCRKKINGVTGDTLGASEEIGQCVVLLTGLWS
jgi:cobalamin 5'-phosphate synthase/cobalamin synthase